MAADGKNAALNVAIREAMPLLVEITRQNPHAQVLVRAIAFSTGAWWHIEEPTPVDRLRWRDLEPFGYTDLGAALSLLASVLTSPPMPTHAFAPAVLLVTDGRPTDDWKAGLEEMSATPWGRRAIRIALSLGRDVDSEMLRAFQSDPHQQPLTASNPEELIDMVRAATRNAGRAASSLAEDAMTVVEPDTSHEVVW